MRKKVKEKEKEKIKESSFEKEYIVFVDIEEPDIRSIYYNYCSYKNARLFFGMELEHKVYIMSKQDVINFAKEYGENHIVHISKNTKCHINSAMEIIEGD